jgi:DNA-binding transcriptional MerR regulator
MPSENGTKPKRETWRDWLPPGAPEPALLSRDELLGRLRAWRIEATERDLRFWEYEGVLPRSIRRSHGGAVRAVYPAWYANLVQRVRYLQREGYPLDQIRRRVRTYARYELGISPHPEDALDQEIRRHRRGEIGGPEDVRLPTDMLRELERLARWHERLTGSPTDHVQVWVVGAEGNPTVYPWPIAPAVRFVQAGPVPLKRVDGPQADAETNIER